MGIQEVQGAKEAPAYQKKKKTGSGEGFHKSFLQNLRSREQEEISTDTEQSGKRVKEPAETSRIVVTGGVRMNAAMLTEAVQTAKVRHMHYEESDHIKIAVTEGYTLKGKREEGADARVYVEAKYEDGRLEAYQVETAKISGDTEHVIERFALETMQERE